MTTASRIEESNLDSRRFQKEIRPNNSIHSVEVVVSKAPKRTLLSNKEQFRQQLVRRLQIRGKWRYRIDSITIVTFLILFEVCNQKTNIYLQDRQVVVFVEAFRAHHNMIRLRPSQSLETIILPVISRRTPHTKQVTVAPCCCSIRRCRHVSFLPSRLNHQQLRNLSTQLNLAATSIPSSSSSVSITSETTKQTRKKKTAVKQSLNTTMTNAIEPTIKANSKGTKTQNATSTRQQRKITKTILAVNDVRAPLAPLHTLAESVSNSTTTAASDTSSTTSFTYLNTNNKKNVFNPLDVLDPNFRIPYPKALSPSSISEFKKCPQSYLFQYIFGLKQPTTLALAKGSMCHTALERIFDLDPSDRSLNVLQDLFRTAWSEHRTSESYKALFRIDNSDDEREIDDGLFDDDITRQHDVQAEIQWGREGLALLANYWSKEDASQIVRPNPVQREIWVVSKLNVNQFEHPSSSSNDDADENVDNKSDNSITAIEMPDDGIPTENMSSSDDNIDEQFLVRGIVDRLDMVRCFDTPMGESNIVLRLIDYKTGKAPDLQYTVQMNDKIQQEAFDQLLIYALLLREKSRSKSLGTKTSDVSSSSSTPTSTIPLRFLRLFYLTSHNKENDIEKHQQAIASPAVYWEMDLGATEAERDAVLDDVYQDLIHVWQSITRLVQEQNMHNFCGCTRSFCTCHLLRPLFPPGTVWDPENIDLQRNNAP